MGKMIKTYRVFTMPIYRVLMLLVAPVVLAALGSATIGVAAAVVYIMLDIFADYWVFGGICSKYSEKLDYIKSSRRGEKLMRRGMRLDRARSFLELVVIFVLIAAVRKAIGTAVGFAEEFSVEFPPDIIAVLAAYTMSTLALNLSRYAETIQIVMAVTYLAGLLGILLYIGCFYLSVHLPVIVPVLLLAVAAVLVSFFTEKHMMYRIKKSYSDGGNLS
jgi:hypothetical protein